jgi:hypothetical protein
MKRGIIVVLLIVAYYSNTFAQCCSQGTPMSGDANVGVLKKGGVKVGAFSKHSKSKRINSEENKTKLVDANFNFIGFSLAYGITHKLTAEFESGYFLNKTQNLEFSDENVQYNGFGLTNGTIYLKHVLLKNDSSNFELSGGLGFKFPFSEQYQSIDGTDLGIDNLPSTYAPGIAAKLLVFKKSEKLKTAFVLMLKGDYNFENYNRYKFGPSLTTSFMASKNLKFIDKNLTGILQVRHSFRDMDTQTSFSPETLGEKSKVVTSGSSLIFIAPQLSVMWFKKLSTSLSYDIPVYQRFNIDRLENIGAVMFSCTLNL